MDCANDTESFECKVANQMKRFTRFLHVFFCLALMITVLLTMGIFFSDIVKMVKTGDIADGTIHALGALLVLWTLAELLGAEIRHLRGESIKVTIFIEVAIAAMVRKLLILSTEGISLQEGSLYLASLLVLGIVYWFLQPRVMKSEIKV
jgi:uncharacterized membrane protein (DUF373 family)